MEEIPFQSLPAFFVCAKENTCTAKVLEMAARHLDRKAKHPLFYILLGSRYLDLKFVLIELEL